MEIISASLEELLVYMVFVGKQFLLLIPFIDDGIFPEKNGIPICDVHPEIFAGIFF